MSDQKPFIEVYWESEIGRQVRIGNWMYVLIIETGEHAWEWVGPEKGRSVWPKGSSDGCGERSVKTPGNEMSGEGFS